MWRSSACGSRVIAFICSASAAERTRSDAWHTFWSCAAFRDKSKTANSSASTQNHYEGLRKRRCPACTGSECRATERRRISERRNSDPRTSRKSDGPQVLLPISSESGMPSRRSAGSDFSPIGPTTGTSLRTFSTRDISNRSTRAGRTSSECRGAVAERSSGPIDRANRSNLIRSGSPATTPTSEEVIPRTSRGCRTSRSPGWWNSSLTRSQNRGA